MQRSTRWVASAMARSFSSSPASGPPVRASSSIISVYMVTTVSGLFSSWTTPAASRPSPASRSTLSSKAAVPAASPSSALSSSTSPRASAAARARSMIPQISSSAFIERPPLKTSLDQVQVREQLRHALRLGHHQDEPLERRRPLRDGEARGEGDRARVIHEPLDAGPPAAAREGRDGQQELLTDHRPDGRDERAPDDVARLHERALRHPLPLPVSGEAEDGGELLRVGLGEREQQVSGEGPLQSDADRDEVLPHRAQEARDRAFAGPEPRLGHVHLDAPPRELPERADGLPAADARQLLEGVHLPTAEVEGVHAASSLVTSRMKTGRPLPRTVTAESPCTVSSGAESGFRTASCWPSSPSTARPMRPP